MWKFGDYTIDRANDHSLWVYFHDREKGGLQKIPMYDLEGEITRHIQRDYYDRKVAQSIPTAQPKQYIKEKKSRFIPSGDKKFVIVIPSYNNSKNCVKNIESALNQDYPYFRILFNDDCSVDDTFWKTVEATN